MQLFFNMIVPFTICGVALYGAFHRVDVYSSLVQGAGEGLSTLVRIVPSLVGLMTAVYMLRASGALELAALALAPLLERVGLDPELLPLMLVRAHQRLRRPGCRRGAHFHLRSRLPAGPDGGGNAGLYRNHLLHHRRLFRGRWHHPYPVRCPGGPLRRSHRLSGRLLGCGPHRLPIES